MQTKKVQLVGVIHEKGSFDLTQGHKRGEGRSWKNGKCTTPTGYGWAVVSEPTKLIAVVQPDAVDEDASNYVFVTHFFQNNWGKLSEKRVNAITATQPKELEVEVNEAGKGGLYYTATEAGLADWLDRAMNYHKKH